MAEQFIDQAWWSIKFYSRLDLYAPNYILHPPEPTSTPFQMWILLHSISHPPLLLSKMTSHHARVGRQGSRISEAEGIAVYG